VGALAAARTVPTSSNPRPDEEAPVRRSHLRLVPPCVALAVLAMIVHMDSSADEPVEPAASAEAPGATGATDDTTSPETGASPERAGAGAPADDLVEAVATTRLLDHGRVELRITVAGPAGPVSLVHRAAFVERGLRVEASSDMSEAAAVVMDAGEQLDGDWSQPTRVVVDDDTVYSQLGPMAEVLGHSPDEWVRARLADVTAAGADNDAMVLALDPLGPLDLLARPVAGLETIDAAATEIRGVPTRHLRATLELQGAGGASPTSFEARLVAAGVGSLPVDVWLDADDVVRRLAIEVEAAGSMTTTFEVLDTGPGDAVQVTPPDPSAVVAVAPGR
jgi:hypothetical protein